MAAHKFLPNSEDKITKSILQELGLHSIDDLFSDVPNELLLKKPLAIPEAFSEIELEKLLNEKLERNKSYPDYLNFLGGGCWVHHVPAVVDEILSRGEFYTAYTPYQPEISQGMLQSMFEYQSQICELTAMDVANSSMYDWGTSLGEAGRMASRVTKRRKVLALRNTSPERTNVLKTYCNPAGIEVGVVPFEEESGLVEIASLERQLNSETAAVYMEIPNFLGLVDESIEEMIQECHKNGALAIIGVDPSTLGILKPPGDYGADIVVGDAQPLGVYPNLGGPLIGIFATKRDPVLLRQMPGRLIGLTTAKDDPTRYGYTMVLQTREQHIRRQQATSNICTNEALFALAVSVYLALMGPRGIRELGEHMLFKSHYAKKRIAEEGLSTPYFSGPFFSELSVKTRISSQQLAKQLSKKGILGGLSLGRFYQELAQVSLFSFNETQSIEDIERLVISLKQIEGEAA